jgi:cobalt-zinc-cadmium efflux system protein
VAAAHDHEHGRTAGAGAGDRRLAVAFAAAGALCVVEAAWALGARSIALGGDSVHALTDVLAYGGAYLAARSARRRPTAAFTYGYGRSGVLAALGNAVLLMLLAALVAAGAVAAALSGHDRPVPTAMLWGGLVALFVSAAIGVVLHGEPDGGVNRRAAFLHSAADAAASAAVVLAALLIAWTGRDDLDAICAVAIALGVVAASWGVVRETVSTLMEAVPEGVRVAELADAVRAIDGVADLHHVHVWRVDEGIALSGHLVLRGVPETAAAEARVEACAAMLAQRFGIGHTTLQVETDGPGGAGRADG